MEERVGVALLWAVLSAAWLAGSSTAARAVLYTLDPAASRVTIHVEKTGLFAFAGHTHEIDAPVLGGTIAVDGDDLARSTLQVEFDAASLQVSGAGEPAHDVPEVQKTMESAQVLDVSSYPRITFRSTHIEPIGESGTTMRLRIVGDVTLHGITRPEDAEVAVTLTPTRLEATGVLVVKQSDFGIKPVTAGAGTVRVKDRVEIDFTFAARASSENAQ